MRTQAETLTWDSRAPFPYKVTDNVLPATVACQVVREWPELGNHGWKKYRNGKYAMGNLEFVTPLLKGVILDGYAWHVQSMLERISGIRHLIPDWTLFGGGLHHVVNGGSLGMHVDFNTREFGDAMLYRRINCLLYLNVDWKPEYGGQLFLGRDRGVEIEPMFNRLVVFESSEESYHGHPVPLDGPEGYARRSIAWYWYTLERPAWFQEKHSTIYV